ncbi:hypothetical protein [Myceligenerans salitolerans]|uniref:Uncharacterized protein n=1 Tax=Myceligenerans salitolerans TaxID=1230528 RepID=A0ABS3I3J0_9MICO|nr:hypothetical protein [Myceligenerans salitolerans]MBO0607550.1 hypothetical protein [Myceligenerans salitolerans]
MTNDADAAMVTDALQHVLTGKRLIAVRYADVDHGAAIPYWREGDRDNLGHGIELDFADGSTWSIIWEQRGSQDGLDIWCGPLMPVHLREARFWDVTRRWRRRGPRTITDLQVFWWPERPAWECGSPGSLSLGGLVLRDHARDRQAIITIDHRFDVNVYFTPGRARRDGHFNKNYLEFGKEPLRTEDGTASDR